MGRKNRIKILCAEHDMNVRELAEAIKMAPSALRRYTRQELQPRLSLAERIAAFLNCTVEEVLGEDADQQIGTTAAGHVIGITEAELVSMPHKLLADLQAYLKVIRS
tara:strand:+ start:128 stop:448 length:321 start_codon:yes stop_codon:yes gene_type:complete